MRDDLTIALGDVCASWRALMPPNRMSVSAGVARNLVIKRPGGAGGPWSPLETSYMVEPVDTLGSRIHSAVCFVGPSQSGKTVGLGVGWLAHAVVNDPGDMLIVQMNQDKAREFTRQQVDRAMRNSPNLASMMTSASRDDNLHDKAFRNGMLLRIGWPTASNLSSTSYRYVFGTDYDRWPDDLDGEGDGFTLMGKRVTTFLSRGMVAVESSPGRDVRDPSWRPASAHEAPPVEGILGIYNRSDRRRLYWKCPHCGEWFQASPGLGLFNLPSDDELLDGIRHLDIEAFSRQYAVVKCPASGCLILPSEREDMNRAILQGRGGWLADGLLADSQDRISGTPRTSSIAGFWLGGVAATYVNWQTLIRKQLQALLEYTLTNSELPLLTTANTDQGVPYLSRLLAESTRDGPAGERFDADLERYVVPDAGRFLVASVDIQGGRNAKFVVQVHAIGEHKEQWLVDRYSITQSARKGFDDAPAPIDPAAHPEDWDLLTDKVLLATYRTSDPEKEMRVKLTIVDSGGEDGVTANAYAWARRVAKAGFSRKMRLTKGVSTRVDWHVRETMVGGKQGAGDVPLHLLDPNKFKDMVAAGLRRKVPGPGYYHFPLPRGARNPTGWLSDAFFEELHAEVRGEDGKWSQVKPHNETLDLCCMILAGCMMLGTDKREFWNSPPTWALPHGLNSEIITRAERRELKQTPQAGKSTERPVRRSSYLS